MHNFWSQRFENKTSRTTLALFTSAILVATIFQPPLSSHASTTTPVLVKEMELVRNELVAVGSNVYFSAYTSSEGEELWKSDGVTATLVRDINPGPFGDGPNTLTAFGDWLYFTADDGITGRELWKTNGTSTVQVADIYTGASGSNPANLKVIGSSLYFRASTLAHGEEIWKSDSTTTTLFRDLRPGSSGSSPNNFVAVGSTLFFTANNGTSGTELWRSDGVTETLIRDINPGSGSSSPTNLTAVGSTLFFRANDGTNGTELWKSDGVTATLISDINPGSGSSSPGRLTVVNSELYWEARQPTSREVWRSDGTSSGTNLVTEIATNSMDDLKFVRIGEELFFLTGDKASGGGAVGKLWTLALPSAPPAPSPPSASSTSIPQPSVELEPKTKTSAFSGFPANSSTLPAAARKGIQKRIGSFESISEVVCTGYTSGTTPSASARNLARQRAKAACAVAKRIAPSAEVRIKVSPAAGIGSKFRSVRVKITGV